MTLSRRNALKLGLGAGALHLLGRPGIIAAEVAGAPRAADATRLKARPLPLTAVRLTGGPLRHAQDLDRQYLLALEPDRSRRRSPTAAGTAAAGTSRATSPAITCPP